MCAGSQSGMVLPAPFPVPASARLSTSVSARHVWMVRAALGFFHCWLLFGTTFLFFSFTTTTTTTTTPAPSGVLSCGIGHGSPCSQWTPDRTTPSCTTTTTTTTATATTTTNNSKRNSSLVATPAHLVHTPQSDPLPSLSWCARSAATPRGSMLPLASRPSSRSLPAFGVIWPWALRSFDLQLASALHHAARTGSI